MDCSGMLNLAFWNVHKKRDNSRRLVSLANQLTMGGSSQVILGLSEPKKIRTQWLETQLGPSWRVYTTISERFVVVANVAPGSLTLLPEAKGCLPLRYNSGQPGGPKETMIWIVHLSSPLKQPHPAVHQLMNGLDLHMEVKDRERQEGHQRSVLIGDFNMEPYASGMTALKGLNAVMCQNIARRRLRGPKLDKQPFFYNPMWGLFGDQTACNQPASYYMDSSTGPLWHSIDQVLLRPDVLSEMASGVPTIIVDIGGEKLLSPRAMRVDEQISDHLPISILLKW